MVAMNHSSIVIKLARRTEKRMTSVGKDLLPWADPYIARLVAKLKAEIQAEREGGWGSSHLDRHHDLRSEAPIPPYTGTDEAYQDPRRRSRQG